MCCSSGWWSCCRQQSCLVVSCCLPHRNSSCVAAAGAVTATLAGQPAHCSWRMWCCPFPVGHDRVQEACNSCLCHSYVLGWVFSMQAKPNVSQTSRHPLMHLVLQQLQPLRLLCSKQGACQKGLPLVLWFCSWWHAWFECLHTQVSRQGLFAQGRRPSWLSGMVCALHCQRFQLRPSVGSAGVCPDYGCLQLCAQLIGPLHLSCHSLERMAAVCSASGARMLSEPWKLHGLG